ncbi:MAG: NADH-quinone oxidoreductase subunit C [Desulfobulbaceae bacterium]|jgi:NADH-quinone oxidoreductase subunit C|nr:NADH-quinone oxidoreductase subunit C [Desulfobulbaceae bacterium]
MIRTNILNSLRALFPEADTVVETPPPPTPEEESGEKKKAGKAAKPAPRVNGMLERDYTVHGYHIDAQVSPEQLLNAVTILDQQQFFLETITGVDWIDDQQLEAVYDFSHYGFEPCRVVIRVRIPRDNPKLPTISGIYQGANWHERETFEFFGIVFEGHPHLVPLLLPEDADYHPLLKDFKA